MSLTTLAVAFALLVETVTAGGVISECNARLPMSLSTVISDLEAEGVSAVGTACFLTSRGVTKGTRASLFGIEDEASTSFGTDAGVCLALSPASIPEMASSVVACGGQIVYYPNEDDLSRGEGLFDSLGPAIERVLSEGVSGSSLTIVAKDPATTKASLDQAAEAVLANLVVPKKVTTLEDVFDSVEYVKSVDAALKLVSTSNEPSEAQAAIATTVTGDFWQATPVSLTAAMSAKDLAAARRLGPAARKAFTTAVDTVKAVGEEEMVSNFDELCQVATKRALEDLAKSASSPLASSAIGLQIRNNLKEEISGELSELCEKQMGFLSVACFEEFQRNLSNLRIAPTLASDMQDVVDKSVADFAKRSKSMPISNTNAKNSFKARLQEFCSERLLKARASGQFKPVPRKGVTIGMHWLLPKPFGNDYRQEPWMVHATDNLVYLPTDAITDVSPDEVVKGDWRDKIVPCPAGNEMLYMQ